MSVSQRLRLAFEVRRCHAVDAAVRRLVSPAAPQEDRLLVIRLDAIGDYLLFRPFLKKLRESSYARGKEITLLGNQLWRDLAISWDSEWVDHFIWLDRKRFYADPVYRFNLQREIRQQGFGELINTTYSRYLLFDDAIVRTSAVPKRLGSVGDCENTIPKEKKQTDSYYTKLFPAADGVLFEFERHYELFSQWLPDLRERPTLTPPEDFRQVGNQPYFVLFPGASEAFRCWPVAHFAQVGRWLHERTGWSVVLSGGPGEVALGTELENLLEGLPVRNEVGKTRLPELAERIAGAKLLVSNETMAPHFAALYGTKTLCIYNGRHRGRFSPYPQELSQAIHYIYPPRVAEFIAQDARLREDVFFYPNGGNIREITVAGVLRELEKLI